MKPTALAAVRSFIWLMRRVCCQMILRSIPLTASVREGQQAAGGKIPLHRSNDVRREGKDIIVKKPWNGEEVKYPDADPEL